MEIEIFELSNTWGCAHRAKGSDKVIYGWDDLPSSAQTWLIGNGDAVNQILESDLGTLIDETPGSYGGIKKTALVDVDTLDQACRAHYDKMNTLYKQQQENNKYCHYCGAPAPAADFFDAPICAECGG